jgi:hypothetical protein
MGWKITQVAKKPGRHEEAEVVHVDPVFRRHLGMIFTIRSRNWARLGALVGLGMKCGTVAGHALLNASAVPVGGENSQIRRRVQAESPPRSPVSPR